MDVTYNRPLTFNVVEVSTSRDPDGKAHACEQRSRQRMTHNSENRNQVHEYLCGTAITSSCQYWVIRKSNTPLFMKPGVSQVYSWRPLWTEPWDRPVNSVPDRHKACPAFVQLPPHCNVCCGSYWEQSGHSLGSPCSVPYMKPVVLILI
jgi:hypothetical protein